MARVLCYGDSNTAGFGNGGKTFHPYKIALEQALRQQGSRCEVVHDGRSGLTAEELSQKVNAVAIRDICGHMGKGLERLLDEKKTDLVIIMLGTNDIGAGTRPQQTLSYVSALHAVCHERGIPTIALAPPTVLAGQPRTDRDRFAQMLAEYERATPDAVFYADCEQLVPRTGAFWQADQLHLSSAGSDQLGSKLAPVVMSALASLEGSQKRNLKVGQKVEYLNNAGQWISTQVVLSKRNGAVVVAAEPTVLIPKEMLANKVRIPGSYAVGQEVEFWSTSSAQWIKCKVTQADPTGSVMVEVKPNVWISMEEQSQRMRIPAVAAVPAMTLIPPQLDGRASEENDPVPEYLAVGQQVEYWSTSQNKWVTCRVTHVETEGGVQVDVKPGTWIFKEDQPGRIRAPQSGAYSVGDQLEYYSASQRRWVKCIVTVVSGANIQIDVKLGYDIGPEEQSEKLRTPQATESSGYSIGQAVEYHSRSCDRWIPCHITSVHANGDINIDAKPGYAMGTEEQAERIRKPTGTSLNPKRQQFAVGQEVDVWDEQKQNWLKDKISGVEETGAVRLTTCHIPMRVEEQEQNLRLPRHKFLYYS